MLRKGRIALMFDGFDELAQRVTYQRATEHFDNKLGGDIGGGFWFASGLCRFEPGELDRFVTAGTLVQVDDGEPL